MIEDIIKNILVIGYGSMGRRRIRLIREILPAVNIICIDNNPKRINQAIEDGHSVLETLEEGILASPDIAVVSISPGQHADVIIPLLSAGIHVFTELNLTSDRYDEMSRLTKEKNVILFVSSTLIYKRQMEYFERVANSQTKPITYLYHVGQYIQDWHPWESYKDFFIGKKETNAIREILAIQLPWMIRTFGKIKDISVISQNCTDLDIDFPDSVVLSIIHENGNIGSFVVDVVSRKATTHLEIFGEDVHVFWDGHNDDLLCLNINTKQIEQVNTYDTEKNYEGYSDVIAEEPYKEEIKSFFDAIQGAKIKYNLIDDEYVLDLIDIIESQYNMNNIKGDWLN